jgi:NAD-dependent DNA ligase
MAELVKKLINSKNDSIETASNLSIEELESIIMYANDKYYNTDTPVITDALYDILIDFLKLKSPKSSVLKNIGAKVKSKNKVKLDYWLGSMNKIKPQFTNQLDSWISKYPDSYNLSDKLDGVSALLTYKANGTINMATRGTAIEGTDITPIIKYLKLPSFDDVSKYCKEHKIKGNTLLPSYTKDDCNTLLPSYTKDDCNTLLHSYTKDDCSTNLIAFRGELIIKEKVFIKKWSDKLKNGRNSVAGLVNSITINPKLALDTDLVLYEIVDPFYPIEKQFKIINDIGFNLVPNKTFNSNLNNNLSFELLSKYLNERRTKSLYKIDGIIVTSTKKQERNVKANPDYAFAFKDILEDQIAKTHVISIEWNISKDGFIIPTLLLEPVNIGGVEIKRATGYNAKFIVDNKIGPGSKLEIIRSGDVIPKVHNVLSTSKSGTADLPKSKWHWNETNVDIQLDDIKSNSNVLIKNIYYFFSTLDTKGLGEKNVEKLINAGLNTIVKILSADKLMFLKVDGFKEKSANNLVLAIKSAMTNIPLAKFMAASNKLGPGLGYERMKSVLSIYPNILIDYKKWSKTDFINKIKSINGWEDKTAKLLVSNFENFINFYDSVKEYITIETVKNSINKALGVFTDKTIVFTGFRDKDLQSKIEIQGGKISSSISKNTDYLIVKDKSVLESPTDKIIKAISLDIKILTKDKLIKLLDKK